MTKQEYEAVMFESFFKFYPSFAGEVIAKWRQPNCDPPDILAVTASCRNIGVEMRSWLHEEQMKYGVSYERTRESIRKALGNQDTNTFRNVLSVWLHPKEKARIRPEDEGAFEAEVRRKIAELDEKMEKEDDYSPQGEGSNDFSGYPVLAKYLDAITCFPRKSWRPTGFVWEESFPGGPWIDMPARSGFSTAEWMLEALYEAIDDKRNHYSAKPPGMHEFYLLIHYDRGLYYNTQIEGMELKIEDVVKKAKEHIGKNPGAFDKIFLYLAIVGDEKVFQLC